MQVGTPNAHLNERRLRPISRLPQLDQLDAVSERRGAGLFQVLERGASRGSE